MFDQDVENILNKLVKDLAKKQTKVQITSYVINQFFKFCNLKSNIKKVLQAIQYPKIYLTFNSFLLQYIINVNNIGWIKILLLVFKIIYNILLFYCSSLIVNNCNGYVCAIQNSCFYDEFVTSANFSFIQQLCYTHIYITFSITILHRKLINI